MRPQASGIAAALVFGVALMVPKPLAAGTFGYDWGGLICGGEATFSFCSSVSVTFDSDSGQIRMMVQNMTGPGLDDPVLTKIAFFNTGGPFTVGVLENWNGHTIPSGWEATTALNSSGGQGVNFGVKTTNGVNGAIPVGGSAFYFQFVISGLGTARDEFGQALADGDVGLSIHAQSGPGGTSSTCLTAGTHENCGSTTSVPEPGTFLLLGTGLAGMAFVRRRRRNGIEEG